MRRTSCHCMWPACPHKIMWHFCSACSACLQQNGDAEAGHTQGRKWHGTPACLPCRENRGDTFHVQVQGIKDISVQSSVSLQHLPYNAELETALPKELQSPPRLRQAEGGRDRRCCQGLPRLLRRQPVQVPAPPQ